MRWCIAFKTFEFENELCKITRIVKFLQTEYEKTKPVLKRKVLNQFETNKTIINNKI